MEKITDENKSLMKSSWRKKAENGAQFRCTGEMIVWSGSGEKGEVGEEEEEQESFCCVRKRGS